MFIKLTSVDGSSIWVNMADVDSFCPEYEFTRLHFHNGGALDIKETIEEVISLMQEKKGGMLK